MTKSYFLLYRKAKELLDKGEIKIINIKDDTYYFQVSDHQTTLKISKVDKTNLWLRHWACDCESFAVWQDKAECKHIKACELYLMMGGIK